MAQKSDAEINIIDMYTPSEAFDNGWFYHVVYIETDTPYDVVEWYIGPDTENGLQYIKEIQGNGVKTRAWFYPDASDCPGNIKGTKYRVAAKVWYRDDDNNGWSDYETRVFRVFQAKVISGIKYPRNIPAHKRGTGIYGSVQLSRHYHDGNNIVVSSSVYAYNGTETTCHAVSWFRHTRFDTNGFTLWQADDPPLGAENLGKRLLPGDRYYNSGSSSISYWVGGNIRPGEEIILNAHIHLSVAGLVWHEEGGAWTHRFTKEDNQ